MKNQGVPVGCGVIGNLDSAPGRECIEVLTAYAALSGRASACRARRDIA